MPTFYITDAVALLPRRHETSISALADHVRFCAAQYLRLDELDGWTQDQGEEALVWDQLRRQRLSVFNNLCDVRPFMSLTSRLFRTD